MGEVEKQRMMNRDEQMLAVDYFTECLKIEFQIAVNAGKTPEVCDQDTVIEWMIKYLITKRINESNFNFQSR
jgi:hypothetical protein